MYCYKLTDEKGQTKGGLQWGENVEHETTGSIDQPLCSDGWIHFYKSPLIAVLMNSVHANFKNPQCWESISGGEHKHEPLKSGSRKLKTLKQIELPALNTVQRIAFAILCAKEVYKNEKWITWADNWLTNKNRTQNAAYAAHAAAYAHAAYAAAAAAAYAAHAYAAAYAAYAADAAAAYAADAADAADTVADAAAHAAYAAADAASSIINFAALANQALLIK